MFSLLTRHREGRTLPFIQYVATMAAVDAIQESADDALVAAGAKGHRRGTGSAVDAKIKWPNDLYSGGLKIGGVLCTSTYSDGGFDVVVGVGINLDNAEPTTCVNDIVRRRLERDGLSVDGAVQTRVSRERLLAGFMNRFEAMCAALDAHDSFETLEGAYLRQWLHTDQEVTLEEDGGRGEGQAGGQGDNGDGVPAGDGLARSSIRVAPGWEQPGLLQGPGAQEAAQLASGR